MSAHGALSAYFKVKKIEKNLKTIQSVYAYGEQVNQKVEGIQIGMPLSKAKK